MGICSFWWNPFERGLLELGLAYDKTGQHAKADATYQKLITHPKFSEGLQARLAREILLLNITDRIGEIPSEHKAWIGNASTAFWRDGCVEREVLRFTPIPWKGYATILWKNRRTAFETNT